jgi:triacylglycerol lipase
MTRLVRSLVVFTLVAALGGVAPRPAGAFCLFNCSYTKTKYPIVLAHGLFGFDQLFGVIDYFFGIPDALTDGGARVFVTQVSAANSSDVRGEQLLAQVEQIVAITGSPKVNLIGHSQGALDVRYVAGVRPDLVASASTVGGVNKGAELADFLQANLQGGSFTQAAVAALGNFLAEIIELLSGSSDPADSAAALAQLSTAGTAAFNARFPGGVPATSCGSGAASANGVRYYSWSGTGVLTNALDISDPLLALTSTFYHEASDGLVGRCRSHLGTVIRDNYFQNHLDEVNQIAGLVSIFEADPRTLFRDQANRLKNAGL